jgi:hypothetical protein
MKKVFPGARGEWSLALLAVGSTALAACGSNSATYRPAPRYTTSPPTTTAPGGYQPGGYRCGATPPPQAYPTYPTQPGQPGTYPSQPGAYPTNPPPSYNPPPAYPTNPPPPPPPRGGQMSCGKGKCG